MRLGRGAKQALVSVNRISERFGIRLQPVHYYSEVPDRRWLSENVDCWAHPADLPGVEWNLDEQFEWLADVTSRHLHENRGLAAYDEAVAAAAGPGYGPIEYQVLYCVVRTLAPTRIVEVGSGVSTVAMISGRDANRREGRGSTEITCIEPYPSELLRTLDVRLLGSRAQDVPLSEFLQLQAGDMLFLDSTHAVRVGSELARIYLDVIPRLPPGVLIHIHDIYLPYLYHPEILDTWFDWQETTLVAALLTNNPRLKVLACLSGLFHERQRQFCAVLPDTRPRKMSQGLVSDDANGGHFPASLWLITR